MISDEIKQYRRSTLELRVKLTSIYGVAVKGVRGEVDKSTPAIKYLHGGHEQIGYCLGVYEKANSIYVQNKRTGKAYITTFSHIVSISND